MALIPTLSPAGYVSNPLEVIDFMMAYFFLTQKSQTHFHKGMVNSYQSLIGDNAPDSTMTTAISNALGDYLKTQFTNVQLDVSLDGKDGNKNNNELVITIACNFTSDGKTYSLNHAIDLLGTQVKRVYRINETGSPL